MSRLFCWFAVAMATTAVEAGLAWAAGAWRIESTARGRVSLDAISCPSVTRCWAVGSTSTILEAARRPVMELWNGHRWMVVRLRSRRIGSFTDLSCASARFCMAVGDQRREERTGLYDSPFAERWNGRTWTNQPMVSITGNQDFVGTSVSCTSGAACVAVGSGFAQSWNGHDWGSIRSPIAPPGRLSCASAAACIAAGSPYGPGAELWNGRKWIPQVIPIPMGIVPYRRTVALLGAISCPAARWCVGFAFVYKTGDFSSYTELGTTWNGRKWTAAVISESVTSANYESGLFGISCPSTRACVAVGGNSVDPIAAFGSGQTWAVQTLPNPESNQSASLYQVSCATATSCMAVGQSGNNEVGILRDPLAEHYQG